MKIRLPLAMIIVAFLSLSSMVLADEKPEVFASQSDVSAQDVTHILLSPNGTLLCFSNGTIRTIYDVVTRRPVWKTVCEDFFFSPDGRTVISVIDESDEYPRWTQNSRIVFYALDAHTGKQLNSFSDPVYRTFAKSPPKNTDLFDPSQDNILETGFSSDGNEFFVATRHFLRRFDVSKGRLLSVQKWHTSSQQVITLFSAHTARDGKTIVGTSQVARTFSVSNALQTSVSKVPIWNIVEISSDGLLWATQVESEEGVDILRTSDGHKLWRLPGYGHDFSMFSADGKSVFAASKTGCEILDARTGRHLKTLSGPTTDNFAPSPDGKWIYEAHGGKIYRWHMPTLP